jgi:integrase
MPRFTDKSIAALRPKTERYEVWEGGGFGVRVSPRGVKTWVWVYHFAGRPRRMTFGTYPAMRLVEAHVRLAGARTLLAQGVDPGERVVVERQAERDAATVEELVERYLTEWARKKKRSADEDERQLRRDVIPIWGKRKAKDIARRDVRTLLGKIVERGSPIAANRLLAVIRKMFNWALGEDIVTENPCVAIKAPGEEKRRDRFLKAEEIAVFWRALGRPELPITKPIRLALKFQLVTAQRKGEVIGAVWEEFDFDEKVWTLPAERSKNKLPHRVPLSPLALAVLDEIGRKKTGWLFPSPRTEDPITGPAVAHAVRKNRDFLGIGDTTPYDLRRTAASQMTSIGIGRLVVSKILNHAEPGVTAVYDRHSYDGEKRAALDAWGTRLAAIVSDNVVDFTRPAVAG